MVGAELNYDRKEQSRIDNPETLTPLRTRHGMDNPETLTTLGT